MNKTLNLQFEKAVRLLVEHTTPSAEDSRKPLIPHDIRVGVFLHEQGYKEEIVLAGLLHDALEWTTLSQEKIVEEFGDEVLRLVLANTKDDSIEDSGKKIDELVSRCAAAGEDALIIKTADILDSYKWYTSQNNADELQYCDTNAAAIARHKPADFSDPIFAELAKWQDRDYTPLENGVSKSLELAKAFLGKAVELTIDQPYGTYYKATRYEANYGNVPGTLAPDGMELDAYFLGPKEPLENAKGVCIAIVHRLDDDDDKLIVVEEGVAMTDDEIKRAVHFREKFFRHEIVR